MFPPIASPVTRSWLLSAQEHVRGGGVKAWPVGGIVFAHRMDASTRATQRAPPRRISEEVEEVRMGFERALTIGYSERRIKDATSLIGPDQPLAAEGEAFVPSIRFTPPR